MENPRIERWRQIISGEASGLSAAVARGCLRLLSPVYGALRAADRWLHQVGVRRVHQLPRPVISVGNLTVGGVGKTPFVAWLATQLQALEIKPVVLARGYGRADHEALNEEGRWLQETVSGLTVLQDADRVRVAQSFLQDDRSDLFLLDDGFQHDRLRRDLDIVLLDATEPFGYGALLPRGLLRESPKALRRAHFILLSRSEQVTEETLRSLQLRVRALAPQARVGAIAFDLIGVARGSEQYPASWLQGREVLLVAGVGNPQSVRNSVEQWGAEVCAFEVFPDHHAYGASEWLRLAQQADQHDWELVTTAKDAMKLPTPDSKPMPVSPWVLQQGCEVSGCRDELLAAVAALARGAKDRKDDQEQHAHA